jgi:hypothetical protein
LGKKVRMRMWRNHGRKGFSVILKEITIMSRQTVQLQLPHSHYDNWLFFSLLLDKK